MQLCKARPNFQAPSRLVHVIPRHASLQPAARFPGSCKPSFLPRKAGTPREPSPSNAREPGPSEQPNSRLPRMNIQGPGAFQSLRPLTMKHGRVGGCVEPEEQAGASVQRATSVQFACGSVWQTTFARPWSVRAAFPSAVSGFTRKFARNSRNHRAWARPGYLAPLAHEDRGCTGSSDRSLTAVRCPLKFAGPPLPAARCV